MQIHGIGQIHGPQSISAPHGPRHAAPAQPSAGDLHGIDQLDISPEADLVSRVRDLPEIRTDKVAAIRAQIESGVYETDEKLDLAVSRLLDEFA